MNAMLLSLILALTQPSMVPHADASRLKSIVEHLATYPTRNTSSPYLTEAAAWVAGEMKKIPGLEVEVWKYPVKKGSRVPEDKEVVEVIAILRGRTDRRVLVGGHMDTINLKADVFSGRAPGADDDASGAALIMESARLLAARPHRNTLVFCVFSGEEQGLFGSAALAARAQTEGWKIDAVLSNDIVGSSQKANGQTDRKHVRVFSDEGSRELARFIEWTNQSNRVKVNLVLRQDRFGRGGDHSSFNKEGFAAVRFTEVYENWERQHNDQDLPEFVDFNYLSGVTDANVRALASLAEAAEPPTTVRVVRKLEEDTTLTWRAIPGASYRVYWRLTSEARWTHSKLVGAVSTYTAKGVSKDDYVFAVGAEGGIPVEAK